MKNLKVILSLLITALLLSGFWSGESDAKENNDAKKERRKVSSDTLKKLYKYAPQSKKMITDSYGYATFTNLGVNLILFSAEGGKGLAHNNKTGKNIYMRGFE